MDGRVRLDGVVESEEFLGSRIRYAVKTGDATILVDASHQAGQPAHDVGNKVALYLAADQLRLLRRWARETGARTARRADPARRRSPGVR